MPGRNQHGRGCAWSDPRYCWPSESRSCVNVGATCASLNGHRWSLFKFLNPIRVLSTEEIREILIKRVDQQKQAVGIVAGVIEPNDRRVVSHGNLANGDSRTLDGDTIFEIGSVSKVFSSLVDDKYEIVS